MGTLILVIIVWIVVYNIIKKGNKIDNVSQSNPNTYNKNNNGVLENMLREEIEQKLKKEYSNIFDAEMDKIKKEYNIKLENFMKTEKNKKNIYSTKVITNDNLDSELQNIKDFLINNNGYLKENHKNTFNNILSILNDKYNIKLEKEKYTETNLETIKNSIFSEINKNSNQFLKKGIFYKNDDNDIKKALEYFYIAAINGDKEAYYNMAIIHKNGIDILEDKLKAAYYMKMAADLGSDIAANEYAIMLATEDGIIQNVSEAKNYFNLAIENGNNEAKENLEILNDILSN